MFVSPMLLQKIDQPFDSDDFITELKLDGIRLIYSVDKNGKVRIYSRHNNEITSKFPELHTINIPPGTILDGELIVSDNNGKPDFEAMMSRFQSSKNRVPVSYVVFDVIEYQGQRVTNLPLIKRKELLNEIIPVDTALLSKVQYILGNAQAYFEVVCQQELEGIVLKRKDSKYKIGKRSHDDWFKIINYKYTDVVITGMRKDEFGLLLGKQEGNTIKQIGIMEYMNPKAKKQFYDQYSELIVNEDKKFIYMKPSLKCRVKFRNYTKAGFLRIPTFIEYVS
ncbi:ATP-dependent DNA ligase [Bacillus sp. ISL-46]|nr:ATP-dependent DNA ligase [Bacillus sp. ISL-46]